MLTLSIHYQNYEIQKIKVINKTGTSSLLNKTYRNSLIITRYALQYNNITQATTVKD
jgi:hypothetical protein